MFKTFLWTWHQYKSLNCCCCDKVLWPCEFLKCKYQQTHYRIVCNWSSEIIGFECTIFSLCVCLFEGFAPYLVQNDAIKLSKLPTIQIFTVHNHDIALSVAVGRGKFGNPGKRTPAVGSRYQKTSLGKKTERTKCLLYWTVDCNYEIAITICKLKLRIGENLNCEFN
jgi:hypothetical protein